MFEQYGLFFLLELKFVCLIIPRYVNYSGFVWCVETGIQKFMTQLPFVVVPSVSEIT